MILKLQLISFFVSFVFGIFFSFFISITYKTFKKSKKFLKFLSSFLVTTSLSIVYFLILKKISSGMFHEYFLFFLLLGCFTENMFSKFANKIKK